MQWFMNKFTFYFRLWMQAGQQYINLIKWLDLIMDCQLSVYGHIPYPNVWTVLNIFTGNSDRGIYFHHIIRIDISMIIRYFYLLYLPFRSLYPLLLCIYTGWIKKKPGLAAFWLILVFFFQPVMSTNIIENFTIFEIFCLF